MLNIESRQKSYTIVILAAISSTVLLGTISAISTNVFAAKFSATLSGNNEVPPVNTKATGSATYRTAANETVIKYKVNITGFSDATGAHIHLGKAGANGDVIVDLLKDSKKNPTKIGMAIRGNITDSDLTGPMQGKTLSDLISEIDNGNTYTNVHTASHPDGEIRGQIESGSGNADSGNQTATVTITDTGNSTNSTTTS
jgi:CHRD domain